MDTREQDGTGSGSLGKNTAQAGVALRKLQSSRSPMRKVFSWIQGSRGLTSWRVVRMKPPGEDQMATPWSWAQAEAEIGGEGGGGRSPNFFGKTVFSI